MQTHLFWIFLFLNISFLEAQNINSPVEETKTVSEQIRDADWKVEEVSEEITWSYHHFQDLFSAVQSITVLEVDLEDEDAEVLLPNVESGFVLTSEAAAKSGATVAINGSFFDTKLGGSVVFLKKEGQIINPTREGFTEYRENAGFVIEADGGINILSRPAQGWESLKEVPNILTSGPMLLEKGSLREQVAQPFNLNRHPRTAIGITADNRLIAVVVDGRNAQAHGMSIDELAQLMQALGCVEAMNLDGGGSSTAWVQGQGVVNYPSDNKVFDHEGERGVATVIAVRLRK